MRLQTLTLYISKQLRSNLKVAGYRRASPCLLEQLINCIMTIDHIANRSLYDLPVFASLYLSEYTFHALLCQYLSLNRTCIAEDDEIILSVALYSKKGKL